MINTFQKGKKKELEAAHLLERLTNEKWKRLGGREYDKVSLSGDIVALRSNSFYRKFSWEVKAQKKQKINDWLEKAIADNKTQTAILLSWDSKYKRWIASIEVEKLMMILEELRGYNRGDV